MSEAKIIDRISKSILGGIGKWRWELIQVNSGGIYWQLYNNLGTRYLKWVDLVKVVSELRGKALGDLSMVSRVGLPINMSKLDIGGIEVTIEDNRLQIFANIKVGWMPNLDALVTWDSVEEFMIEGGMT